jgi:hypothetical protein
MYKDTAAKYKDKFDGLKSNEQKMREFANVASQQLSQYYLEMNMQTEADILRKQSDVLASLTGMDEAIRDANRIMEEGFRKQEENFKLLQESSHRQEEYLKDLKKHSPFGKLVPFLIACRASTTACLTWICSHIFQRKQSGFSSRMSKSWTLPQIVRHLP